MIARPSAHVVGAGRAGQHVATGIAGDPVVEGVARAMSGMPVPSSVRYATGPRTLVVLDRLRLIDDP